MKDKKQIEYLRASGSMPIISKIVNIPFIGYLLSAILDCLTYMAFLLLYRKKRYDYWMKKV